MTADKATTRYTFWLSRIKDEHSPYELVRCVVDHRELRIYCEPPYSVPIRRIINWQLGAAHGPRLYGYSEKAGVRIEVLGKKDLFESIVPVNPLDPNHIGDMSEAKALITVIKGFKTGSFIELNPNPYFRKMINLKREPKAGEAWDANVSPIIYYRVRTEPSVKSFYFVIGLMMIFVIILAWLSTVLLSK